MSKFKVGDVVRWVGWDSSVTPNVVYFERDGGPRCGDVPPGSLATITEVGRFVSVFFWHNQRQAIGFSDTPFELVRRGDQEERLKWD